MKLRYSGIALMLLVVVVAVVSCGGGKSSTASTVDNIAYTGSFPAALPPLTMTRVTLTINNTPRDLLIYRPTTAQSLPLLIFFEGTGSDITSMLAVDYSWLSNFALANNLIIAVPAQRVMTYGDWDNHVAGNAFYETAVAGSTITTNAVSSDPNTNPDLLFTRAIIKEASVAYGADLTRVYVNGYSNGAFFSYFVAATLSNRIAAFAESSGGLALGNTTDGAPTLCVKPVVATQTNNFLTCAQAGWTVGLCSDPNAIARPIAPVASMPPGFMEAQKGDQTVPFAHTCNLANALPASPTNYKVRIVDGNQHGGSTNYLDDSWLFMKKFTKP